MSKAYSHRSLLRATAMFFMAFMVYAGCDGYAGQPPVLVDTLIAAPFDSNALRYEKEIRNYEISDSLNPGRKVPVVFTGSSSVAKWKTLEQDMAPLPVINRGFGGSAISHVTWYADRILVPLQPELIVLYAGENDIAYYGGNDSLPLKSLQTFMQIIQNRLPDVKVLYLSMKPSPSRFGLWKRFSQANALIAAYADTHPALEYLDISAPMLDAEGNPREDIFVKDKLHLNEAGYALWTQMIRPKVSDMWKARPEDK